LPELKLTVTTAQWNSIKAAFTTQDEAGVDIAPDAASMRAWILGQIKDRVQRYELGRAGAVAEEAKRAELKAEGW
jgi:hypothetical protein